MKYAESYKIGNTQINVVAPPPMTEEEKNKILAEYHAVGWAIWESMQMQEKMQEK